MAVGKIGNHPAARRALDKALLNKIGFVEILERLDRLACRDSEGFGSYGTAAVPLDYEFKDKPILTLEPEPVYVQR